MPAPIDLSQIPARPAPPSKGVFKNGKSSGRGTGTALDEYARKIFWAALILGVLLLGYLLAGLYSGAWAKAAMKVLYHASLADYNRQIDNITTVFRVLQVVTLVLVVSLLITSMRDESLGYILVVLGLIFYAGLPFLTSFIYDWRGYGTSVATQMLMRDFQLLAWVFFVPGIVWTVADLVRRFQNAAETAAIQRANVKYGANVKQQPKVRKTMHTVLSRCWELPYCRDHIREKCPVYIKRSGPCWWHKEGCMCEERIILQAVINTDWKQQSAKADIAYNFGKKRSELTPAAKRARCQNCIIYNEHQRQKYKALVIAVLVVVPTLLYLNAGILQGTAEHILVSVDAVMQRFSFDPHPGSNTILHTAALQWTLIGALGVIVLAQVLKFIEFWCFKLKI